MAQAASRNFTELAILRTLSGAAEAIADPAFMLISSTWWTRAQQPRVIGLWYCANGGGIGLGGLLGYAIGSVRSLFRVFWHPLISLSDKRRPRIMEIRVPDHRSALLPLVYRALHLHSRFAIHNALVYARGAAHHCQPQTPRSACR